MVQQVVEAIQQVVEAMQQVVKAVQHVVEAVQQVVEAVPWGHSKESPTKAARQAILRLVLEVFETDSLSSNFLCRHFIRTDPVRRDDDKYYL